MFSMNSFRKTSDVADKRRRGMRAWMTLVTLALSLAAPSRALGSEEAAWAALRQGGVVLFRHAIAPGGGDPPGFRLNDCATQRNLDEAGRQQARRIGATFASRGVAVGVVLTSQWCRARETAALAFPGQGRDEPIFNSFFADRGQGPAQTAAARPLLARWTGPGALVVVTHQVNVTGLTGIVPASGEGVVVRIDSGGVSVVGRIRP
jgi:phosphohistidine phosphatase SixA